MLTTIVTNAIKHKFTSIAGLILGPTGFKLIQAGCGTTSWKAWVYAVVTTGLLLAAKDPGVPKP